MELAVTLFILAALVMGAIVFFGMLDTAVMPWACPSCHHAPRSDAPSSERWYHQVDPQTVSCRSCGRRFKEHPNGALVEDRG